MSTVMNGVLGLLTFQSLLGAFDNLWHHELACDLPHEPAARKELSLHTARELLYAVIFSSAAWLRWEGVWAYAFIGLLACEIIITISDFVEEDRSRRLPSLERVLHTILALSYGATLAVWTPELVRSAKDPTGFSVVHHGAWSWLMSLFAIGVFAWGVRDLFAVARLGVPEWQRQPMRAGSAANPRVVLVTGATGFVGRALTRALVARGDLVIALSRRPQRARDLFGPWVQVCGNLSEIGPHRQIDAIVNLAGAPVVGGWWTNARRRRLIGSRLQVTEQVLDLIERLQHKPFVLVNASAVGFYGERGDEILHEGSGKSTGFLSELCQQWEAAAVRAEAFGVRVCRLRIGLVLGNGGGVLQPLALAARFGGGAVLGNGRQWVSWIHLHDLVRMIEHSIDHQDVTGALNAVAPVPVVQQQLMQTLAATLHRRLLLRIPTLALRTLAGEMADLFLISQRVAPERITQSGFQFVYPTLADALSDVLSEPNLAEPATVAVAVYMNMDCPVCRAEMGHFRQVAERKRCEIAFNALQQAFELEQFGLAEADLRRRLFVLTADGKLCSGIDAAIALWRTLPGYRWLASLMSLPGLHHVTAMVYDLIGAPLLTRWSARTVNVDKPIRARS